MVLAQQLATARALPLQYPEPYELLAAQERARKPVRLAEPAARLTGRPATSGY
jgi:hypothetical protein